VCGLSIRAHATNSFDKILHKQIYEAEMKWANELLNYHISSLASSSLEKQRSIFPVSNRSMSC